MNLNMADTLKVTVDSDSSLSTFETQEEVKSLDSMVKDIKGKEFTNRISSRGKVLNTDASRIFPGYLKTIPHEEWRSFVELKYRVSGQARADW